MYQGFNFRDVLSAQAHPVWQIGDVLPEGAALDLQRPFLPEALARTGDIPFLKADQRRLLNQIRGHEYLSVFGVLEAFILPFVIGQARPVDGGAGDRALLQFASEEAKHILLFQRFDALFTRSFGQTCEVIGPAEAIARDILSHDPLSVALMVLHIEWMTQRHYVESVRDNRDLDPLFRSLLRHHWIEEAQHAQLDVVIVETLARGRSAAEIEEAVEGYFDICAYLDSGLRIQTGFNLDAFERATGRALTQDERAQLQIEQHQALRWTYLGSGMTHPQFLASLGAIAPGARERVANIAPAFC
ncbi:MAG TPA: hypothetical protein VGB62_03895 [Allosphingosinicella sp.]|jgi:hypothetical protein